MTAVSSFQSQTPPCRGTLTQVLRSSHLGVSAAIGLLRLSPVALAISTDQPMAEPDDFPLHPLRLNPLHASLSGPGDFPATRPSPSWVQPRGRQDNLTRRRIQAF